MIRVTLGKQSSVLLRVMAAAGLVIAMMASLSHDRVTAQQSGLVDDRTYVFSLGGMVVEWGGNWEFDPASSGQDVGVEVASFLSPLAGLLIGELQGGVPLDLDQFLVLVLESIAEDADEFVTVERSATDTVSYSLDAAVIDGIPAGLFTYIQPNTVTGTIIFTSILAEATTFAASVADAQANVTINGRIALEGIDGAALQDLLPEVIASPQNDDRDNQDQAASDEDSEDEPDDSDRPSFDNRDETPPDEEEEEDGSRTRPDGDDLDEDQVDADSDDDLADLGLVDDGLYESPQFGIEIEWSDDWTPNPDLLASNDDDEVDNLGLNNEGGALVLFTIFEAGDTTPEDFAGFWQSDDFLDENASPDAEVLLADSTDDESAVLIADVLEDGEEFWSLRQAYSLDGGDTIVTVLLIGLADDFPDNLEEAQDGIGIDGEDVLSLFSINDIEDAG